MARLTREEKNVVEILAKVPLFAGLEEKELRVIADAGHEVSFESGRKIMEQGESGLGFLLVLEGKVEVRKKGRKVATLGPGNFFGEMSVIDDKPRSADVVAVEPTKCFGMASWNFYPVLRRNPGMAIGIIKELVCRLREAEDG